MRSLPILFQPPYTSGHQANRGKGSMASCQRPSFSQNKAVYPDWYQVTAADEQPTVWEIFNHIIKEGRIAKRPKWKRNISPVHKKRSLETCATESRILICSLNPGTSWKFLEREIFHKWKPCNLATHVVEVVSATILSAAITPRTCKPWEPQTMKVYSGFQADFLPAHKEGAGPLMSLNASSVWGEKKGLSHQLFLNKYFWGLWYFGGIRVAAFCLRLE